MSSPSGTESSPANPDSAPDTLASVIAFARALTGTLRPLSLLDRLVQEVKASFGPFPVSVIAVDEQGGLESASGDIGHPQLEGLLTEVLRTGQPVLRPETNGTSVGVPLRGKRALLGSISVAFDRAADTNDLHRLVGMAAVATVALEAARVAEVLDQSRQRWEEAIDAVSLALCLLDRGGRIERVNRSFTELLSLTPITAAGRPWQAVVPPVWREGVAAAASMDASLLIRGRIADHAGHRDSQ
jgi:PAS domain-containing protein